MGWRIESYRLTLRAMNHDEALATLRAHEAELKAAGVENLLLFGSVARGDATTDSDVDVVVRLTPEASEGGFAYSAASTI